MLKFENQSMKSFTFIFTFFTFCNLAFAQNYAISGQVEGLADGDVLLGYYYGEKQYVKDTVQSVNGAFIFEGESALDAGMYFMLLSDKQFFQFIIDRDRTFSFSTSTTNLVGDMKIEGSPENTSFYNYQQFTQLKGLEVQPIKEALNRAQAGSKKESKLNVQLTEVNEEVNALKAAFMLEHSNSLFVKMLKALEPINIPVAPLLANGAIDSTFQYKYFKKHFLGSYRPY